ncbi:hypothetical protein L208DRAFT_1454809 [Tricholoma matsutake]|nr:hypothetical protein L208DRAFT_1454809 [Tricholoma matsutake 945]
MPSHLISVLTIAGSDSSGGAGIQADLKTFAAHGCYGATAITALTAQNTIGVQDVHPAPPAFVEKQIHSILSDMQIHAIKTGMLYDADNTRAVAQALSSHYRDFALPSLVCDPVCASTSGHILLDPLAIDVMISDLFPLARLITPNKAEAELLLSHRQTPLQISNLEDMLSAAQNLLQLGSSAVLLKGGHVTTSVADVARLSRERPNVDVVRHGIFEENMEILQLSGNEDCSSQLVVDVLFEGENITLLVRPRIQSTSTHGTGCTLSAAIAAELAQGNDLKEAVKKAVIYTYRGIETAPPIGKGHGPLDHFHGTIPRTIPRRTKHNRHPFTRMLIQGNLGDWKAYVEHEFVKRLGMGTLSRRSFTHFITQDYHYLKYYARAYGLLAAKSSSFTSIEKATQTIINIVREVATHQSFCTSFGISDEELEKLPEASATTAYGAYLIDVGLTGDSTKLLMALLACLLGYGEVGLWLRKQAELPNSWVKMEGNPYRRWIEDYAGDEYQNAVKTGLEIIEERALADPPSPLRLAEWRAVWERCTLLEKGFWDAAMMV